MPEENIRSLVFLIKSEAMETRIAVWQLLSRNAIMKKDLDKVTKYQVIFSWYYIRQQFPGNDARKCFPSLVKNTTISSLPGN